MDSNLRNNLEDILCDDRYENILWKIFDNGEKFLINQEFNVTSDISKTISGFNFFNCCINYKNESDKEYAISKEQISLKNIQLRNSTLNIGSMVETDLLFNESIFYDSEINIGTVKNSNLEFSTLTIGGTKITITGQDNPFDFVGDWTIYASEEDIPTLVKQNHENYKSCKFLFNNVILDGINNKLPRLYKDMRYDTNNISYCYNSYGVSRTVNIDNNLVVCFSGFKDEGLKKTIENIGGKVVNSVTKKCNMLILKPRCDKSVNQIKAEENNIVIIDKTGAQFLFSLITNMFN